MNPWSTYQAKMNAQGGGKRGALIQRERRFLNSKLPSSLSYHQVFINGAAQSLAIINSDNFDTKTLCSMPGEDFPHGGTVDWMKNKWLIISRDANNELYTRGIMRQCNYLLRWISDDGKIIERWCIVEDGTKYLTGEYSDNNFVITRGDSRVSLTLPKDEYTIRLNRNNRFLIDNYDSPNVLAYRLSKPFKLGGSYDSEDSEGVLYYILQECNTEDTDNLKLHIANYYDYFPRDEKENNGDNGGKQNSIGRKVWI